MSPLDISGNHKLKHTMLKKIPKIAVVNGTMFLLSAIFLWNIHHVWTAAAPLPIPASNDGQPSADGPKTSPLPALEGKQVNPPSKSSYGDVVDKNLFSQERAADKKEPEKVEQSDENSVLIVDGRKIRLYGVVIDGNARRALINEPDIKNSDRRVRWISKGDRIGQYKVVDISKNDIVFSQGAEEYRVSLWDSDRKKASLPNVTSNTSPTVIKAQSSDKAESSTEKKSPPKTISPSPPNENDNDDMVIIKTPFGTVKRKK